MGFMEPNCRKLLLQQEFNKKYKNLKKQFKIDLKLSQTADEKDRCKQIYNEKRRELEEWYNSQIGSLDNDPHKLF